MKSKSRQTKAEAVGRANRMKSALNLATCPHFGREYGEWEPGGNPAGYFVYNRLGYEIRLRFSQENHEWTATCPHFAIRTTFPNQAPENIQILLDDWLTSHIHIEPAPHYPPVVLELADDFGTSTEIALEMYKERAS